MDREGNVEVLRGREHGIVARVAERPGVVGERRDVRARAPSPTARSSSRGGIRIAQRKVRGGYETVAPRAELADPPVVRARVRLREIGIVELGLPQQADRRVQHDGIDALGVQHLQPLVRVHAPVRRLADVGAFGIEPHRMQVRIAHRSERGRKALTAHDRRTATDLERFEVGVVAHDAQRAVTELRLEVGLPQVRRLEDVAVGVDGTAEPQLVGFVHRLGHVAPLAVGGRTLTPKS